MQNRSSACFSSRQRLIALLAFAATCSTLCATLLGSYQSRRSTNPSQRTLTFEDRVVYQRLIEEIYWRHRTWPKERTDPKPPPEAIFSHAQLERKVANYLRKSQALEDYWHQPITAEQLQAEMDRMAKHTKQPDVLREVFQALNNDPFVIAECVARPALADRLLTSWYAHDQRIHGELKQRAESELQAHPSLEQMKQLSGKYSEIEFIKSEGGEREEHRRHERGVRLTNQEWDQTVQKLAAVFRDDHSVAAGVPPAKDTSITQIRSGVLSSLQEDEEGFYAAVVIQKMTDRMRLATVSWPKEPVDAWLAEVERQVPPVIAAPNTNYSRPAVDGSACVDDSWTATSGPPGGRYGHTAVWTGSEMIVWGGFTYCCNIFNSGGRYNPSTDSWTATVIANAPDGRWHHTAVWTGNEMIIWGGDDYGSNYFNTGGRYDPATDSWMPTSVTNAPTGRTKHTTVWTGTQMIVWGGYDGAVDLSSGGRYDANTNTWTTTSTTNAPSARELHTAVWTGSEMIIWGGSDPQGDTGGRYNPGTDSWSATTTTNAPDGRARHTAVWTGSEMIVWGGDSGGSEFNTGGKYNPSTNSWTATTLTNAPSGRASHAAVWSGSEMIVWGGFGGGDYFNSGGRYQPNTDTWTSTGTTDAPIARSNPTAIWSGSEMIIWGGVGGSYNYSEVGGRYNPIMDSWLPTGKTPDRRSLHSAVWTGTEMIIWGGFVPHSSELFVNTGGKYDPSTDSWMRTSVVNAPTGREFHSAVWTGTEMIVWGGYSYDGLDHYWNTGGRYDPTTGAWAATNTTNAPLGREFHTAVWTGSEMVVWGGYFYDGVDHELNTGGKYNPNTNSWTATSTINAPTGRDAHGAVWTGSEMIIWGGAGDMGYLNTGGRYSPVKNNWTATTTISAPEARTVHGPVWTGSEMIVWGGYFFDGADHWLNTGGRYNPGINSWTPSNTADAPDGRSIHTAVWTGSEMIIWGGEAGSDLGYYFNSGGRYDWATDSWIATSIANAADGRYRHTAVWTGNEMIVWGGILYSNTYTSSGGRYCVHSGPTPTPTATPTPTPTPTPCTGRCTPTPRPRPTPHPRP